jgi:hypothetical protein
MLPWKLTSAIVKRFWPVWYPALLLVHLPFEEKDGVWHERSGVGRERGLEMEWIVDWNEKNHFVCKQARIKKIMQADEEVGKIAMATPVLICMFLPPSTHDLLPFHHHLLSVLICILPLCARVRMCVCVLHTHTTLSVVLVSAITYIEFVFLKLMLWCLLWTSPNIWFFFIYEKRAVSFLYGGLPRLPKGGFSCVECLFNHDPVLCSQGTGAFSPEFVRQDIWNHFAKGSQNNEFAASVSISFCPISTTTLHMKQSCWTRKSNPSLFSFFTHMRIQIFLFCSFFLKFFYKYMRTPIFLIFSSFSNFLHILRTQILVSFLSWMS